MNLPAKKLPSFYHSHISYTESGVPTLIALTLVTCRIQCPDDAAPSTLPDQLVSELVLPATCDYPQSLFTLELPYSQFYDTTAPPHGNSPLHLPWCSTPFSQHPHQPIITKHNADLVYHDYSDIIPVQLLHDYPTRLRLTDEPSATHLLSRIIWNIPDCANATNSFDFEDFFGHCNSEYTALTRDQLQIPLYYHCVSHAYRHGVDYWLFPKPPA